MGEQTEARLQRAMDVIVRIQRIDNPKTVKAFEPFLRKDGQLLLEAIDGPEPDWSDLREMARNAGWTRARGFSERGDAWLPPARDGYRQEQDGWVIVEHRDRIGGRRVVTLVGTGKYPKRTACLVDPSPSEILIAARLVGLVGGVS